MIDFMFICMFFVDYVQLLSRYFYFLKWNEIEIESLYLVQLIWARINQFNVSYER